MKSWFIIEIIIWKDFYDKLKTSWRATTKISRLWALKLYVNMVRQHCVATRCKVNFVYIEVYGKEKKRRRHTKGPEQISHEHHQK